MAPRPLGLDLLVHLRLHFQLLLAPVFLWGVVLADGQLGARLLLAFLTVHVFLYGGITAFNSAYDRDTGPVGGLRKPPPVSPALLPFALGVKLLGWGLALLINLPFFVLYGLVSLLSVGYSHPRFRFKARPLPALATVAVGQGVLPFLAAWAAVRGEVLSAASGVGMVGVLASTGIVLGFYPLTQLFQVTEDRRRGDRTVAVAWGPQLCFLFSLVCLALGGVALLAVVTARWSLLEAGLLAILQVGLLAAVAAWGASFQLRDVLGNYAHVMRLNTLAAAGLSVYLLIKLVG